MAICTTTDWLVIDVVLRYLAGSKLGLASCLESFIYIKVFSDVYSDWFARTLIQRLSDTMRNRDIRWKCPKYTALSVSTMRYGANRDAFLQSKQRPQPVISRSCHVLTFLRCILEKSLQGTHSALAFPAWPISETINIPATWSWNYVGWFCDTSHFTLLQISSPSLTSYSLLPIILQSTADRMYFNRSFQHSPLCVNDL